MDTAATTALYVPAAHGVQLSGVLLPGTAFQDPAAQKRQNAELVAPARVLNVPAGHGVHSTEPASLKVPAVQGTHEADELAPTTVLDVPLGHAAQATDPAVEEYSPAAHGKQVPLPATNVPRGQPRLLQVDAPRRVDPAQASQLLEAAPAANVPAAHRVHVVPSADAYVPGPQGTQEEQYAGGIAPQPTYPTGQRVQLVPLNIRDAGSQKPYIIID